MIGSGDDHRPSDILRRVRIRLRTPPRSVIAAAATGCAIKADANLRATNKQNPEFSSDALSRPSDWTMKRGSGHVRFGSVRFMWESHVGTKPATVSYQSSYLFGMLCRCIPQLWLIDHYNYGVAPYNADLWVAHTMCIGPCAVRVSTRLLLR